MAPVAEPVRSAVLSSTVAWSTAAPGRPDDREVVYALEGNIVATGAAIAWVASLFGVEGRESELEALAASVDDAGDVYLVPAFAGLGAPHWDADARGLISGLDRGTGRAQLARAAFDSVTYQVRDVLDALQAAVPTPLTALYADGGAMQSDLLARLQADVIGLPVLRTRSKGLSAMGAGYLAGLAIGLWGSVEEIRGLLPGFDRVDPSDGRQAADERYRGWRVALRRAASDLGRDRPGDGRGA
jgi:glycerol kinase